MNWGDIIFYVLDTAILVMLVRMRGNSRKIHIQTTLGPRWVIPALFWAIAALGFFNYKGVFRWIQTIALIAMGGIYWTMESGLAPKGVVMIGRLYPYDKCKPITVDDKNHCVNFTIRRAPTPVYFLPEQMKEVRNYLSKHAGIAKHSVRTRNGEPVKASVTKEAPKKEAVKKTSAAKNKPAEAKK